jgi:hypothetical protein
MEAEYSGYSGKGHKIPSSSDLMSICKVKFICKEEIKKVAMFRISGCDGSLLSAAE